MDTGYVKLWRCTLNKRIFSNPKTFHFAIWCLLKATYKEKIEIVGLQEVPLKPGQFVFGRDSAARELKTTAAFIRSRLRFLEGVGFLTIKPTNKFSIISIVNWHIYQHDEEKNNQQNNQQTANKPPTNRQQTATNKNIKNINNTPLPPTGGDDPPKNISEINPQKYSAEFETWYELYPKKRAKDAAYRSWKKISKSKTVTSDQLCSAIKRQVESNHFRGRNGEQFYPNPSTWLNQGRWQDEIKSEKVEKSTPCSTCNKRDSVNCNDSCPHKKPGFYWENK